MKASRTYYHIDDVVVIGKTRLNQIFFKLVFILAGISRVRVLLPTCYSIDAKDLSDSAV